jgi:hypothetical protein
MFIQTVLIINFLFMEYFSNKEVNELFLDYLEMRQEK